MSDGKKHSILAPSAASRWMACTPSARLAEQYGESKGSVYANEGSLAHNLAELCLSDYIIGQAWMAANPGKDYHPVEQNPTAVQALNEARRNPLFYEDMLAEIRVYVDHCINLYKGSKGDKDGARMLVEVEVPLFYKTDDTGTIDNAIMGGADNTLYITDLKFGKGIPVTAENNKQLLIYAISVYDYLLPDDASRIERIVMTIVQPRRDSITEWIVTPEQLAIERDIILARANAALAGKGELKSGAHCRFCPVKPKCKALAEGVTLIHKMAHVDPRILTDGEISHLLGHVDVVSDWIVSVKDYAKEKAIQGVRFEGYKLVAGTSRRKITDDEAIFNALVNAGYEAPLLRKRVYLSLSELEKTVSKEDFAEYCTPWIEKPEAAPVLVPVSDLRKEYGVAKAVEDFAEYRNG